MRLLIFISLVLLPICSLFSQSVQPFQIYLGVGPANVGVEPAFNITRHITLGGRYEKALYFFGAKDYHEAGLGHLTSIGGFMQVYLQEGKKRWFVGAGIAKYKLHFYDGAHDKIGFYPRIGYEKRKFYFSLDYNIVGHVDHSSAPPSWEIAGYPKNHYISLRFGIKLGGRYFDF